MRFVCRAFLVLLCLGGVGAGHAAEHPDARTTSIDATPYRLLGGPRHALSVDRADVLRHLDLAVTAHARLERRPLGLADRQSGEWIRSLVDYRDSLDLDLSLGLFGRMEAAVMVPLILTQAARLPGLNLGEVAESGIGDLTLRVKVLVLQLESGVQIAVDAPVGLPTGNADAYMSSGGFSTAPALVVTRTKSGTHATFRLAYFHTPQVTIFDFENSPLVRAAFGVTTPLSWLTSQLQLAAEVIGRIPLTTSVMEHGQLGADWGAGLSYQWRSGFGLGCYMGGALTETVQSPGVRGGLSLSYVYAFGTHPPVCDFPGAYLEDPRCPPDDTDEDGIADPQDKCPDTPEDLDDFQDSDGCPEPDNDEDSILDTADNCPNDAEDLDGHDDTDGCPDLDNDQDGIPDSQDKCPLIAENMNGVQDEDGCPEADADNDGVLDDQDKCPAKAEDIDNFEDTDGCPDLDNDQDGVPDASDLCPLKKENVNGHKDEDGCPDEVLAVKTEKEIAITEEIHFLLGQVVPRRRSRKVLKAVIRVMRRHPELVIRVEGYTDAYGGEDFNYFLSQARAQAIRDYLVRMGGPKDRLSERIQTVGRGKENPSGSNRTLTGRAKNRRVRFVIVPSALQP